MDPAARAVDIFDAAPVFVFCCHFQGHVFAGKDPINPVGQARTTPRVALVAFQADKARDGQVGDGPFVRVARRGRLVCRGGFGLLAGCGGLFLKAGGAVLGLCRA